MGFKDWLMRRASGGGALARTLAQAYKQAKQANPHYSHEQLLGFILLQRAAIRENLGVPYPAHLESLVQSIKRDPSMTLADLTFEVARMETPDAIYGMTPEDQNSLRRIIAEEIQGVLGHMPPP